MARAYWFKPKKFGYGATPTTWEGWAITGVYCLVVWACVAAVIADRNSDLVFAVSTSVIALATVALVIVSYMKTDGRWGWNAGARQISGKND